MNVSRFGGPAGAFYTAVVQRVQWLDGDGDPASQGDFDAAPYFDLRYDQVRQSTETTALTILSQQG